MCRTLVIQLTRLETDRFQGLCVVEMLAPQREPPEGGPLCVNHLSPTVTDGIVHTFGKRCQITLRWGL